MLFNPQVERSCCDTINCLPTYEGGMVRQKREGNGKKFDKSNINMFCDAAQATDLITCHSTTGIVTLINVVAQFNGTQNQRTLLNPQLLVLNL